MRAVVTLYIVRGTPGVLEKVTTVETNELGHYEFTNLAPPRYDSRIERCWYGIVARADEYPTAIMSLFEGTNPADVDLNFAAKSTTLSGRVTDADGEPVSGATVFQYGIHGLAVPGVQSAVTNKIGRFRIDDVPDYDRSGRSEGVQFRITHPDQPATSVSVPALPADAVFRFARGCTVTGTVRDKVSGQPAAGALVQAQENKNTQNDVQVLTDEQGALSIGAA